MSKNKIISNRKRLSALFISFTILVMGTVSLLDTMSFDYYSVTSTLLKIIPASLAMGFLGWVMGMILDKPKKRRKVGFNNLILTEMKSDLKNGTTGQKK